MSLLDSYGLAVFAAKRPDIVSGADVAASGLSLARVCEVNRDRYAIVSDDGFAYARIKTSGFSRAVSRSEFPAVGDFVLVERNPSGDDRIWQVLPRATFFSRRDPQPRAGDQIVAANFDLVLCATSLDRDFNPRRIERYIAAALQGGARPVVLLTKADLCADPAPFLAEVAHAAPGVEAFAVSARTGAGMDALRSALAPGITAVLLGMSGTGKSSLVNALSGRELMKVGAVRESDGRGRHTTTVRELVLLDSGAILIDTPGMRLLGLGDADEGLAGTFPEIGALAARCRFPDCRHGAEPGCAVRAAIADGSLDPRRWAQYLKLERESSRADDPAAYAREKREWGKGIAKRAKEIRRRPGREEFD